MSEHEPARKPALVAGAVLAVVLSVLFALLLVVFDGGAFTAGRVLVVLVLLAGWALWCAAHFGPADAEAEELPDVT